MTEAPFLTRRNLILGVAALPFLGEGALAGAPTSGRLGFSVLRSGSKVGEHIMTFRRQGAEIAVQTSVDMRIRVGPVPVFRYVHQAEERWQDGEFQRLETRTTANGKAQQVTARRVGGAVVIEAGKQKVTAPAGAAPLTHWNAGVLRSPLFNPQEGKLLAIQARRLGQETIRNARGEPLQAVRWSIRGDAEIDNWYDEAGVWAGLKGVLPDKSVMEYRRL